MSLSIIYIYYNIVRLMLPFDNVISASVHKFKISEPANAKF